MLSRFLSIRAAAEKLICGGVGHWRDAGWVYCIRVKGRNYFIDECSVSVSHKKGLNKYWYVTRTTCLKITEHIRKDQINVKPVSGKLFRAKAIP